MLLLHGWGCDSSFFAPITKKLSENYCVTVLDLPAHGKSDKPAQTWGVKDYAQIVCCFLDALALKKVVLIGHSNGGRIGIYIASQYPEYIEKLIITGGAGIKKPSTPESEKKNSSYQKKKNVYNMMKKIRIFGNLPDLLAEKLRMKYGSADYKALDPDMRGTFIRIISEDLSPMLRTIQAPTLLIWGENDTETPIWMGKKMEKEIPNAGLVIFEKGSHYAYLEQWKRFTIIADYFIKGE